MKRILFSLILLVNLSLFAQDKKSADALTGLYQVDFYHSRLFKIAWENERLTFEIVGQGKTSLTLLSGDSYSLKGLPNSSIEFIRDGEGRAVKLIFNHQPFRGTWMRIPDSSGLTNTTVSGLQAFAGKYAIKGNTYMTQGIRAEDDHLVVQVPGELSTTFYPTTPNHFLFKYGDYTNEYEFLPGKKGIIKGFNTTESGPISCSRIIDTTGRDIKYKHIITERKRFTEADTLQGTLSPLRSCYDVLFYNLDVTIDPDTKSIHGSNELRFKSVQDFTELQIDLFANMNIEKILFHNQPLTFTRKFDAVFIHFPETIKKETQDEIQIVFSGTPQQPDMSTLSGGFLWLQDKNGKPWIEVVSQGVGASLWWPCKDHLSDKPDSMHITVTIPSGLTAISNGQFIGKTELPDKQTRFQWAVHYPINTYNAVLYIGDYTHISDLYDENGIKFPLNYYYLSYNEGTAKKIIEFVKPMLSLYQRDFGPYPFSRDGYALVESPYGMEHQSAVSVGSYTKPDNQKVFDYIEMQRMLWHESAHEWWGNAVTCSDYADFWIHETFASYAEVLSKKNFYGEEAEEKLLLDQPSDNKEPIIGFYGVNDFHMGDMYTKGARMIATLRCVMNNDTLFFNMLRGLQKKFAYQSVNTNDIVGFINEITHTDYSYLFDQYLKHPKIPTLNLSLKPSGNGIDVRYQWQADVADFRLPVKVTTGSTPFFIYPTTEWKTLHLDNTRAEDFQPEQIHEYYKLNKE
jgi:Peptidase family M1 domain/Peptidase M1 N-terminal domain